MIHTHARTDFVFHSNISSFYGCIFFLNTPILSSLFSGPLVEVRKARLFFVLFLFLFFFWKHIRQPSLLRCLIPRCRISTCPALTTPKADDYDYIGELGG